MRSVVLAACAAAALLAGCATAPAIGADPAVPDTSRPEAVVTRDGTRWEVVLKLDRDVPIWGFSHSARMRAGPQWRPAQWRVETAGVVLDRINERDVLRSVDGGPLPREVRLSMTPAPAAMSASYTPALVFSDGSVALYSDQFDVFPLASQAAAEALPDDLNGQELGADATRVTWRDQAGPVLMNGERVVAPTAAGAQTYVLFGDGGLGTHPGLATVVDPAIPNWIRSTVTDFAPRVMAYYTGRLGAGQTERPTVMATWNGPTPGVTSLGGSVLPGLIVASFEGEGMVEESAEMKTFLSWFVAHEGAHFWLGQTVAYEFKRDMWITEGGAEMAAFRATQALDPAFDARGALQESVDDCARLAIQPVVQALQSDDTRAFYACGAVFALAAEAAQKRATGGDWFDFLKGLIDGNREDGVVTRDEWLEALLQVTGDPDVRREVDTLLDEGAADPAELIARLFDRAGIAYRLEDGKVRLL